MFDAWLRAIVFAQEGGGAGGAPGAGGGGQGPAGGGGGGAGGPLGSLLIPFAIIAGLFWLLLIRPQRQKDKERKQMITAIKKNDHVVTIGGIHGVVAGLKPEDDEIILKVDEASNVKLRVSRSAIARVVSSGGEPASSDEKD